MRLVLQCAMCGTHHAVGTATCSTCNASGVSQLRLMFECEACGALGLSPACAPCADRDLLLAEEVPPFVVVDDADEEFELTFDEDELFDLSDDDFPDDEATEFDKD
ncbi:MAG: hypothetical protein FJ304_03270 [Planctomycetes bacterium]|nr:hypothetical protein [Planctomycetota bacterium]